MARIVAMTYAEPGHLFATVSAVAALVGRGHDVTIATNLPLRPDVLPSGMRLRTVSLRASGLTASAGGVTERPDLFALSGEPAAEAMERLIVDERPDAAVVDAALWGAGVSAEAHRLPWARLAHNPLYFRGTGIDVRGPGLAPRRGALGYCRDALIQGGQWLSDRRRLPTINAVRARRALPPLRHPWELFDRAPLTLALTAPPFEYERTDWPPRLAFVGPTQWEVETAGGPDDADGRPVIMVVGSSVPRGPGSLAFPLGAVVDALDDARYRVLVTAPCDALTAPLAAHVQVSGYAPHGRWLRRAVCVICHGGAGIVHKALGAGVPVVAIPTGLDRAEIARRVEVSAAGVRLPLHRVTRDSVKLAVARAIGMRDGARRLARTFAAAGGAMAAAVAIEGLLAAST